MLQIDGRPVCCCVKGGAHRSLCKINLMIVMIKLIKVTMMMTRMVTKMIKLVKITKAMIKVMM